MKQNTRDKRLVKTHFFFPACFFLFLTVNLSAQNNIDPWWHPAIRALKKQAPGVIAFARSPEQLVQVCIVDTVKGKAYYVSQFGFVVDSIGLTANRKKQIRAITDQTVPFRWFEDSIGRYLAIFEDAKTFLRAYGSNFKKAGVLQQRVLSLPLLKAAPSTLAMLLEIETYERELQQVLLHFNWQVTTGRDIQVQFRQAEKPGSIIMHGTADSGYSEFINKEELVTTRKARLDHSTGGIRLYDWHNKVVDSFAINPGKVKTVIDEKADVFVLYHAWLEWKLQELNTVLPAWQYAANYELLTNRRGFIDAGLHNQRTGKAMLAWLQQEKTQVLEKLKALTTVADNVYSTNVVIYVYQENKQLWQWNGQGWVPEISPFYKESYTSRRGLKQYELTDHRGNVVATVSDKKTGVDMDGDGRVDSYEADITSVADYYPFGSSMPGRDKNSMEYRYGFNGKENDNEVKGKGSQQDYGMRIYDPRVGRFLSVDPLTKGYPFYTPYSFAGNKPIQCIDLDGAEEAYQNQRAYSIQQAQLRLESEGRLEEITLNGHTEVRKKPADRLIEDKGNWKTQWQKSHNFFAGVSYNIVNGFYTTGQQFKSSVTGKEYIENIGGGIYDAHGPFGEKQRTENFVNAATTLVPTAPVEGIATKTANKILTSIEEQATEHVTAQSKNVLVQANRAAGNAFRDELANLLTKEGREVSTEVFKKTPFGKRFIDIEVSQGSKVLGGIEAKVGGSPYLPLQRLKDLWLHKVQGYPVNLVRKPLHW